MLVIERIVYCVVWLLDDIISVDGCKRGVIYIYLVEYCHHDADDVPSKWILDIDSDLKTNLGSVVEDLEILK